jgi:hypothetical protein
VAFLIGRPETCCVTVVPTLLELMELPKPKDNEGRFRYCARNEPVAWS